MKTVFRTTVKGFTVRVVYSYTANGNHEGYQAEIKGPHDRKFQVHAETETLDHAHYWALDAIRLHCQDAKTKGIR